MAGEYRFVVLDGAMRSVRELVLTCVNDNDAVILSEVVGAGAPVEIWQGSRMITRRAPPGGSAHLA